MADRFVDNQTGDDSGSAGSWAAPWQTVQYAIGASNPGDNIIMSSRHVEAYSQDWAIGDASDRMRFFYSAIQGVGTDLQTIILQKQIDGGGEFFRSSAQRIGGWAMFNGFYFAMGGDIITTHNSLNMQHMIYRNCDFETRNSTSARWRVTQHPGTTGATIEFYDCNVRVGRNASPGMICTTNNSHFKMVGGSYTNNATPAGALWNLGGGNGIFHIEAVQLLGIGQASTFVDPGGLGWQNSQVSLYRMDFPAGLTLPYPSPDTAGARLATYGSGSGVIDGPSPALLDLQTAEGFINKDETRYRIGGAQLDDNTPFSYVFFSHDDRFISADPIFFRMPAGTNGVKLHCFSSQALNTQDIIANVTYLGAARGERASSQQPGPPSPLPVSGEPWQGSGTAYEVDVPLRNPTPFDCAGQIDVHCNQQINVDPAVEVY